MSEKKIASKIANEALRLLREQELDCTSGGYYDVSQKIHTAILHAARDVLRATTAATPPHTTDAADHTP